MPISPHRLHSDLKYGHQQGRQGGGGKNCFNGICVPNVLKDFGTFIDFRSHGTQFGMLIYSQEIIFVLFERRVYSEHVTEIIMSR